jgi:hypothetical protein
MRRKRRYKVRRESGQEAFREHERFGIIFYIKILKDSRVGKPRFAHRGRTGHTLSNRRWLHESFYS